MPDTVTSTAATQTSFQQSATSVEQATDATQTMLSSDFETFLQMLTVQMQNQDPLNPVDSTDYATQLATFAAVEQQVLTNDLLTGMAASLTGNALQQASQWVGMEALARAPVYFTDQIVTIRPEYDAAATSAELEVINSSGETVQTFALDNMPEDIAWTGTDEDGNLLPVDTYSFRVLNYVDGVQSTSSTPLVYNQIVEARTEDGELVLRLSDGSEVTPDTVTGLRSPLS